MTFYVSDGASRWAQCFALKKQGCFSAGELRHAFDRVYDTCRRVQKYDKFGTFTMIVSRSGRFHIDFASAKAMPLDDVWKGKYLV